MFDNPVPTDSDLASTVLQTSPIVRSQPLPSFVIASITPPPVKMGGSRNISHGRGGAGNIYSAENRTSPKDLVTPTIKQEVFTTGRGGSGNMMVNDPQHPEIAREMQDVESPPLRVEDAPHHTGRGGAANAYIPTPEEEKRVREQEEQLRRVRTASRDRLKERESHEHSEKNHDSSSK